MVLIEVPALYRKTGEKNPTLKTAKYIFQYISNKMQRYSLFISGNCSTCFGWYHHPSSGAQTTASTASGISHAVTAICRYCKGTGSPQQTAAPEM
jgi:hypothetical protein